MYGLYGVCRWNVSKRHLYRHGQHWVYGLRRWINLQYHHKRGHVYHVRHSLRSRDHLSVYSLYSVRQPRLYCLYCVRSRNVQKHGLYGLGQHGVYLLCSGHDLQHDHQCGLVYDLYDLRYWNLCLDGLYSICQSCLYGLRRWNLL